MRFSYVVFTEDGPLAFTSGSEKQGKGAAEGKHKTLFPASVFILLSCGFLPNGKMPIPGLVLGWEAEMC